MTNTKMTLVDWLDDLCVRFIVNLPNEELQSVERICFQIEEAQWFYEDFIRPLDPNSLPSMHLRKFSQLMFQHCPLFSAYSEELHQQAYEQFLAYKTRVPVRGAIMLNHDMTHAVLVKGWKKGAKWSFPRGKINKEETDLDCAVREVYEETGFDLTQTDLVLPDEDMKKITVTMREQSMMLYVFRGVPMDTHFEPRTRKEISKIDWYKLTDLPTLRRKNQAQQQGTGQDLVKESSFYMVAPFLGPLKSWIKQQHKLDRQRLRNSAHLAPPIAAAITDDEDMQAELYDTAADHTIAHQNDTPDVNFADIIAKLGRTHRPSDALPELSEQSQAQQSIDPAAELKRLLSVGMGMQSPTEVPGQQPQANALLALFQQDTTKPSAPAHVSIPHTPFDQNMPTPVQPTSPHGQHQPRLFQPDNMHPPPPFPFPPQHGLPFHGHHSSHLNNSPHNNNNNNITPHMFQLHQHKNEPVFPAIDSSGRQMPGHPPAPPFHPNRGNFESGPQFAQSTDSQAFGARGSGPPIPPASKLPPPKMNAHTLGLLNAFRTGSQQEQHVPLTTLDNSVNIQDSPSTQHARQHASANQRHHPNELSSPQFQSPPINIQPAQPKPRSAHQDSLLTLFRATPPISSPEPAELSALPTTPGYTAVQPSTKPVEVPAIAPHNIHGVQHKSVGITSATVRAPVNAPDFETVKKHTQQNVSGSSRGPSPAAFAPQQLLRREQSLMVQSPSGITTSKTPSQDASKASSPLHPDFQPQILKRPNLQPATVSLNPPTAHSISLLEMFKSPSPQPSSGQPQLPSARSPLPSTLPKGPDQQESLPSDQKNALLALFGRPSPKPESSAATASPQSTSRSPLPPTPKTTMSGLVSPVSPLPDKGSHAASPADATARSRISSIGDGGQPSTIPPTSHPASGGESTHPYTGGFSGQARNRPDGKSPVDKTFLLGFLEDVARRGR